MIRNIRWPVRWSGFLLVIMIGGCASQGPSRHEVAQVNYELGVGYWRQGQYDVALQKLRRAKQADPMRADIHSALGLVYESKNRPELAEEQHQDAVSLVAQRSSHYGVVHNNYGAFLCRHGELNKAMDEFQKAIGSPQYDTPEAAYENMGVCALRMPDLERAEQAFRKALQRNPRMPTSLLHMAEIEMNQDNPRQGRAFLQRYHQIAPATPESLWLGFRIERALGEQENAQRYAQRLTVQFPESQQANRLGELDKVQEEQ